jgi:hypothetical protein
MATNWLRDLDRADFAKRCPLVSYDREKRPLERIFRKVQSDGTLLPVLFVFSKPHDQLTAAFIFHTLTTTSRKSGVTLGLPESQTGGQVGGNSLTVMVQNLQVVTVSPLRMTSSVVRFDTF